MTRISSQFNRIAPVEVLPYGGTMASLSHEQSEELRRCGERLAGELHNLFDVIAPGGRTVREVASVLEVDRNIAQRALAAAQPPVDGLQVFIKMPGIRSLRTLAEKAKAIRKSRQVAINLVAAITEVENQILTVAGHQMRLRAMIKEHVSGGSVVNESDMLGPTMRARMHAYQGAVDVAGSHCELSYSLRIYRTTPGDPSTSECATVKALLGQRSRPGGMAFTVQSMTVIGKSFPGEVQRNRPATLQGGRPVTPPHGEPTKPDAILKEFSTHNIPITCAARSANSETHVVEPTVTHGSKGIDLVTAYTHTGMPNPMRPPDYELTHLLHVILPAKRLLLDVFLHKDMASKANASFGGFIWTPEVQRNIQTAWFHRIPGTPPLSLLGKGLNNIETDAWHRHEELVRSTFNRLGWDPNDYVGYRGDVLFPVWAAKYAVIFGFEEIQD